MAGTVGMVLLYLGSPHPGAPPPEGTLRVTLTITESEVREWWTVHPSDDAALDMAGSGCVDMASSGEREPEPFFASDRVAQPTSVHPYSLTCDFHSVFDRGITTVTVGLNADSGWDDVVVISATPGAAPGSSPSWELGPNDPVLTVEVELVG
jgi:hypothetical protein